MTLHPVALETLKTPLFPRRFSLTYFVYLLTVFHHVLSNAAFVATVYCLALSIKSSRTNGLLIVSLIFDVVFNYFVLHRTSSYRRVFFNAPFSHVAYFHVRIVGAMRLANNADVRKFVLWRQQPLEQYSGAEWLQIVNALFIYIPLLIALSPLFTAVSGDSMVGDTVVRNIAGLGLFLFVTTFLVRIADKRNRQRQINREYEEFVESLGPREPLIIDEFNSEHSHRPGPVTAPVPVFFSEEYPLPVTSNTVLPDYEQEEGVPLPLPLPVIIPTSSSTTAAYT